MNTQKKREFDNKWKRNVHYIFFCSKSTCTNALFVFLIYFVWRCYIASKPDDLNKFSFFLSSFSFHCYITSKKCIYTVCASSSSSSSPNVCNIWGNIELTGLYLYTSCNVKLKISHCQLQSNFSSNSYPNSCLISLILLFHFFVVHEKKNLINYALYRERIIESCPWIEIYAENQFFVSEAQRKNAIAILKKIYLYAMCFMHENCIQISRLFLILLLLLLFFRTFTSPACGSIDTHKNVKKN
jgi:hypothetical protein